MDKDRVKGTVDDAMGRAKRQAGEWTGDLNKQMEGAGQQVKGKVEKAWGNMKDAAREHGHDSNRSNGPTPVNRNQGNQSGHKPR